MSLEIDKNINTSVILRIWPAYKNVDKPYTKIIGNIKIQNVFFLLNKKNLFVVDISQFIFQNNISTIYFSHTTQKSLSTNIFYTFLPFFIFIWLFNNFILEITKCFHYSWCSFMHMTFRYTPIIFILYKTRCIIIIS